MKMEHTDLFFFFVCLYNFTKTHHVLCTVELVIMNLVYLCFGLLLGQINI